MRRSRPYAVAAALLTAAACAEPDMAATAPEFAPTLSVAEGSANPVADSWLVVLKGNDASGLEARVNALGGRVDFVTRFGVAGVSGLSPEGALRLAATRGIDAVEADVLIDRGDVADVLEVADADLEGLSDAGIASSATPQTAGLYGLQWHLRQISAPAAWAAGQLGEGVSVAVLDGGIDYLHADLNGRVDMDKARSFLPLEDPIVQQFYPGAHPVADLQFHGTHVAATIASNAQVGAGVTSRATIVPLKVCYSAPGTPVGACSGNAIFQALDYTATAGVKVANMSLGGSFLRRDGRGFHSAINRAFNFLNQQGVTVVVAAGNDARDLDQDVNAFKTYCDAPNVVCVSATGPTRAVRTPAGQPAGYSAIDNPDALAPYSNFGRSAIAVAAPGGAAAPVWAACTGFSRLVAGCRTVTRRVIVGLNGTSMATPHVAGLAVLLAAQGKSPAQVRAALQQGADDLGQPGTDKQYGKGRINVPGSLGL